MSEYKISWFKQEVKNLPESDKLQIMKDFDLLEADGFIGDCVMRTVAEKLMPNSGAAITMVLVANAVHREFAERFIALPDN